MSWNFKSKNILTPVSDINFIPSGPLAQKYSSPNLNAPTSGIILVSLNALSESIVSIATIILFLKSINLILQ